MASLLRELLLGGFWFADKTPLALWVYLDPVWADLICRAALSLAIPNGVLAIVNLLPVDPLVGGDMLNAILEKCFGKGATNAISMVVGTPFVPRADCAGHHRARFLPPGCQSHARPGDCDIQSTLDRETSARFVWNGPIRLPRFGWRMVVDGVTVNCGSAGGSGANTTAFPASTYIKAFPVGDATLIAR